MIIDFDERNHVYAVNGEIATISVTELLAKHGLAPNYKGASRAKLEERAKVGKEVHKDLENIINDLSHEPTTEQGNQFKQWAKMNLQCAVAEQKVGFEFEGFTIAGTIDLLGVDLENRYIIGDHKNTSKFHREYVSWQVSLYDYFLRRLGAEKINGRVFSGYTGAKQFYCFHYDPKTAKMTIYELEKIDDEEIEKLIECERKGEKYSRPNLYLDNEIQKKFLLAEQLLVQKEKEYKIAKQNSEKIHEEIVEVFEKQHVLSWESPNKEVLVTYYHPTDVEGIDKAKLKSDYPEVYKKCLKVSHKKSYITVKLRGEENEE